MDFPYHLSFFVFGIGFEKLFTFVFVLYKPNIESLFNCVRTLIDQDVSLVFVQNCYTELPEEITSVGKIIRNKFNLGIGSAQNIGVDYAFKHGADFVVLCDQDTYFPSIFVEKVREVYLRVSPATILFPKIYDSVTDRTIPVTINRGLWRTYESSSDYTGPIFDGIASGMVIPKPSWDSVGRMREDLFIDWVDFEWCWRAGRLKVPLYTCDDIHIIHQLGDSKVNTIFGHFSQRSPLRHYYITRNAIYLAVYAGSLSFYGRLGLGFLALRYVIGFSILFKPRLKNLKNTTLGVYHGLTARLGKL